MINSAGDRFKIIRNLNMDIAQYLDDIDNIQKVASTIKTKQQAMELEHELYRIFSTIQNILPQLNNLKNDAVRRYQFVSKKSSKLGINKVAEFLYLKTNKPVFQYAFNLKNPHGVEFILYINFMVENNRLVARKTLTQKGSPTSISNLQTSKEFPIKDILFDKELEEIIKSKDLPKITGKLGGNVNYKIAQWIKTGIYSVEKSTYKFLPKNIKIKD